MAAFQIIPDPEHLKESIALAEEYSLGFEYNDFFSPSVLDDERKAEELIERYRQIKVPGPVTSHGDFFDVLVFSEDKEVREISLKRIRQSLKISERLGAVGTVFHSNICPQLSAKKYIDNWLSSNEHCWREICAEYPGQQIWLENMFDADPAPMAELALRLKDIENFGICFDYAHACCFGMEHGVDEWAETMGPYIKHVHINDNDLKRDLHLAVGNGKIDWEVFKKYFERYMKDASILIENNGIDAQRASIEYLKKAGLM